MKRFSCLKAMGMAVALAMPVQVLADAGIDIGKREYEASCAICHGMTGKGDGVFGELLQITIPDLTRLSKKNGGEFPVVRVYSVIDGRLLVKSHGTREMPIWGNQFTFRSIPEQDDYRNVSEEFVRSRILALIDYLDRLQIK